MEKIQIIKQNGFNFLWVNNDLWMWDTPMERILQEKIASKAYGNVLVAGYGLGLIQKFLSNNKDVDNITTIEKFDGVIDACKEHFGKIIGNVIIDNFYNVTTDQKYDCIIGDIWEDISEESLERYIKFKNKSQHLIVPGGKIFAWGQDFFEFLIDKNANLKSI